MSDSTRRLFRKIIEGKGQPAQKGTQPGAPVPPAEGVQPRQAELLPAQGGKPPIVPPLVERLKPGAEATSHAPEPEVPDLDAEPALTTYSDARLFLQQVRSNMARLSEEFAEGKLNSKQFHEIYAHYQKQRRAIEAALDTMPGSEAWQEVIAPGQTGALRERNAAKVLSYAIYDNITSLPLASIGDFAVDTALLVPMLSSFRSATAEMFGGGLRSTEIEGGRWLCFVPGKYTTLFVIFSVEPARLQLTLIEDLHRDFEVANRIALEGSVGEEAAQQFASLWALDRTV